MKIAIGFSQPTPLSDATRADNTVIKEYLSGLVFPGTELELVIAAKNWSCDYAASPTGSTIYLSEQVLTRAALEAEANGADAVVFGLT